MHFAIRRNGTPSAITGYLLQVRPVLVQYYQIMAYPAEVHSIA